MKVELEWDEVKRDWTLNDRCLDFADVALVNWDQAFTIEDLRQIYPETRYITHAPIKDRLCALRGAIVEIICG